MTLRRILIAAGLLLIFFLAMYSWNRRTGILDNWASNVGLEITGAVLKPLRSIQDVAGNFWDRYFNLVDVRGENIRLKTRVEELEAQLLAAAEDLAELKRLRALVQFPVDVRWRPLAARVLAGRMGPNAVLDSITISRGYAGGARPGVPIVTNMGLVGRILRSSAHASTALLITDPGSRVAVFGQESRAPGILKGHGMARDLEVDFVQRDASMLEGEVLVTSGLDDKYPKGLPVARVTRVAPSDYTQFMAVEATPLVDLQHLEEVLLLEKSGMELPLDEPDAPGVFVGPPLPQRIEKARAMKLAERSPDAQPHAAIQDAPAQAAATAAPAESRGAMPPPPPPVARQQTAPENGSVAQPDPSGATPGNIPRNREGAPKYRIITP